MNNSYTRILGLITVNAVLVSSVWANNNPPVIKNVTIHNDILQIEIVGRGFLRANGNLPTVRLRDNPHIDLSCEADLATPNRKLVCDIPILDASQYVLAISDGNGTDNFDLSLAGQGIEGLPGPQGETGPIGPQGEPGIQGIAGEAGIAGAIGSQGPQGLQGSTGPAGAQGSQGDQGLIGAQGVPGVQGIGGEAGAAGAAGPQGLQGTAGLPGAEGTQGPAGAAGIAGVKGIAGPSGLPGQCTVSTSIANMTCQHTFSCPDGSSATVRAAGPCDAPCLDDRHQVVLGRLPPTIPIGNEELTIDVTPTIPRCGVPRDMLGFVWECSETSSGQQGCTTFIDGWNPPADVRVSATKFNPTFFRPYTIFVVVENLGLNGDVNRAQVEFTAQLPGTVDTTPTIPPTIWFQN